MEGMCDPEGSWEGALSICLQTSFRPPSPDSYWPGQEALGNFVEVKLWLLIIFLGSQVLTPPQVAHSSSLLSSVFTDPSPQRCAWLYAGPWGHEQEADAASSPQGALSVLFLPSLFSCPALHS